MRFEVLRADARQAHLLLVRREAPLNPPEVDGA
jgi:magnesium and cobalt transporter